MYHCVLLALEYSISLSSLTNQVTIKPKSVIRLYRVGQNSPMQTIYLGKQSGFSGNERGIGHACPLIWRSRQECWRIRNGWFSGNSSLESLQVRGGIGRRSCRQGRWSSRKPLWSKSCVRRNCQRRSPPWVPWFGSRILICQIEQTIQHFFWNLKMFHKKLFLICW